MFMATSSEPSEPPNTNNVSPSVSGVDTTARSGKNRAMPTAPPMMIGLLP